MSTADGCFRRIFKLPPSVTQEDIANILSILSKSSGHFSDGKAVDSSLKEAVNTLTRHLQKVDNRQKVWTVDVGPGGRYPGRVNLRYEGYLDEGAFGLVDAFQMTSEGVSSPVRIVGKTSLYGNGSEQFDFLLENVVHVLLNCSRDFFLLERDKWISPEAETRDPDFPVPSILSIVNKGGEGLTTLMEDVETSLADLLNGEDVEPAALEDIFIQLIYQLYWLQRIFSFVHGDLHAGNVMVARREKVTQKRYHFENITGERLYLDKQSSYKVSIIDFGQSCMKDLENLSSTLRRDGSCDLKVNLRDVNRCDTRGFDMLLFMGACLTTDEEWLPEQFARSTILRHLFDQYAKMFYKEGVHYHDLYNCYVKDSEVFHPGMILGLIHILQVKIDALRSPEYLQG